MSREVCGICWCPYDEDTGECSCAPQGPTPPYEAKTEAEKIAYCAGWWAALEKARKVEPVQECPNCASLQDQNTELDCKLEELERKPMNEFDALRLVTENVGLLQSAGPVEGLIGIIRAVERAHGIGGQDES